MSSGRGEACVPEVAGFSAAALTAIESSAPAASKLHGGRELGVASSWPCTERFHFLGTSSILRE